MTFKIRPFLPAVICLAAGAGTADRDVRIETAAKRSYNFKVHLKGDDIQVKCKDGTVTLSGTVADSYHKSLAEETVADLPGVKAVVNELTVPGQAPAESSDAWLAVKVKTALLYHRNVNAAATKVDAKDGVVTLSGEASSSSQKALTADICRNLDGVKDVVNDLKVVTPQGKTPVGEKIDDASVTAQVKASLLFHRGTRMLATRVKTERGVVTIRGTARNPAEKDLVTRLVTRINGVKRVENLMKVGG